MGKFLTIFLLHCASKTFAIFILPLQCHSSRCCKTTVLTRDVFAYKWAVHDAITISLFLRIEAYHELPTSASACCIVVNNIRQSKMALIAF